MKKPKIDKNKKARIKILKRLIPNFKEERLINFGIQLRTEPVPYDDKRFTKGFKSIEDRSFLFEISNEKVDSYNTVFLSKGWDLSLRDKGKRYVTYQHPSPSNADPNVIIGKSYEEIKKKRLMSKLILEPWNTNTTADAVCNKLHFGSLTDASVEAYIMDGYPGKEERGEDEDAYYFSNQLLITWGVVMRGGNEDAMIRSFDRCKDSIQQSFRNKTSDVDDLLATQRLQFDVIKAIHKI